ncbi:MAG: ABC transporter permease [Sedimentisphaerales bacterium]|nr:ABC transporter permease [Sedimentisphaerales bacterium]
MLKLFLWLRYLSKRKIVFLSIAAVALSVSMLIVVASLFTGFINTFEDAAVIVVGDVLLQPPGAIPKYDLFIEELEKTAEIDSATACLNGYGLLHLDKGNVRAVQICGIEPSRRARVVGFDKFLLGQKDSGQPPSFRLADSSEQIGCFAGISVLCKPDEETDEYDYNAAKKMLGREVFLTTGTVTGQSSEGLSRADIKRKLIEVTIEDIVETGIYQFDNECIYLPIEKLSEILYPERNLPVAEQIHIKIAEGTDPAVALAVIIGVWRNFVEEQLNGNTDLLYGTAIETARQLQSRLIAAYERQMGILLLIFGIISFGVVLLVFCIFYMIVKLKQKDIAIMKSCGVSSGSVAFIFVGFGLVVGAVGSALGTVIGCIITRNVNTIENWIRIIFGLKLWRSSVYLFSRIPNEVNWLWVLWIVISAIAAAAIGTLVPAVVAAMTRPVEILRYE